MGNLIDEIKIIKNSAKWYYQTCDWSNDRERNKQLKEYNCLLKEYEQAVSWLRMCNIEIDLDVK